MWREMLMGWVDLALLLPRFLTRLFGRAWVVVFSAVVTFELLTRGFSG